MQETICRSYWKYGRSLWQEDIDRFLARKVDIWSLADPLPVSRAGVLWTNQGFVLEAETERDNGEDAYLVPVIAGGTVIDLCAFGIENNRVATRHGNAIADINLFRYCQGVIHFDAQISDLLSILVCPSKSWTALRFPVRR